MQSSSVRSPGGVLAPHTKLRAAIIPQPARKGGAPVHQPTLRTVHRVINILDYAWASYGDAVRAGKLFDARRK